MATPCKISANPCDGQFSSSKRLGTPSHTEESKPKLQFNRLQEAICSSGGKMTVAQRAALLESPAIGKFDLKHRLEQDGQKENANENHATSNAFSFWGSANKGSNGKVLDPVQRSNKIPRTLKFDSPQQSTVPPEVPFKAEKTVEEDLAESNTTTARSPEARKPLTPITTNHHPNTSPFRRLHPSASQVPTTLTMQDTGRESWLPPPPAPCPDDSKLPNTSHLLFPAEVGIEQLGDSGKKRKSSELYELSQTTYGTANNRSEDDVSFVTAKGQDDTRLVDSVVAGDVVISIEDQLVDQNVFASRPEGANPSGENIGVNLTREVVSEMSLDDCGEETVIGEDGIELQCCVLQMHTKRSIEKCVESVIHDVLASKPPPARHTQHPAADAASLQSMAADVSRKTSPRVSSAERQSSGSASSASTEGDASGARESLNSSGGEASLTEDEVQRLREEVRRARDLRQRMLAQTQADSETETPAGARRSAQSPLRIQGHPPLPPPPTPPTALPAQVAPADECRTASPASGLARRPLVGDNKPVVRDIDAEVRSAKKAPRPLVEPELEAKLAARSAEVNQGQADISYAPSRIDTEVRSARKAPKPALDGDLESKLAARRRWERSSMLSPAGGAAAGAGGEMAMNFAGSAEEASDAGEAEVEAEGGGSSRSLFTPCKVPDAVVVTDKDKLLAEKLAARRKWERENSVNLSRSSPALRGAASAVPPAAAAATDSPFRVVPLHSEASACGGEAGSLPASCEPEPQTVLDGPAEGAATEDSRLDAKLAKRRRWEEEEEQEEEAEDDSADEAMPVAPDCEEARRQSAEVDRSGASKESETKSLTAKDEGLAAKLAGRRAWEQRMSHVSHASLVMDRSLDDGAAGDSAEPEKVLASAILDLKELCAAMESDHAALQGKYAELEAELGRTQQQLRHCASKEQIQAMQHWLQAEIKTLEDHDSAPAQPQQLPKPSSSPQSRRRARGPESPTLQERPRKVRCGAGQCVIS